MTGKKRQKRRRDLAKPDKAHAENSKVQMQDIHFNRISSPRDAASGHAKS